MRITALLCIAFLFTALRCPGRENNTLGAEEDKLVPSNKDDPRPWRETNIVDTLFCNRVSYHVCQHKTRVCTITTITACEWITSASLQPASTHALPNYILGNPGSINKARIENPEIAWHAKDIRAFPHGTHVLEFPDDVSKEQAERIGLFLSLSTYDDSSFFNSLPLVFGLVTRPDKEEICSILEASSTHKNLIAAIKIINKIESLNQNKRSSNKSSS